jgi:hypothetical protein
VVKLFTAETFKEIPINAPLRLKYAISNYGRLVSFSDSIENGRILKGGKVDGYRTLGYKMKVKGKIVSRQIFLYKLIAQYFIPKESEAQIHVLHLDYRRDNDQLHNLKWATTAEKLEHYKRSPHVLAARSARPPGITGKLTSTQVIRLKKRLQDPNRKTRVKLLAKEFGISEMQLHRIKRGENWGHIKV